MSVRTLLYGAPAACRHLQSLCRRVSFWSAVVLPFVALSLFLSGLRTTNEILTFVGLVAASVLAIVGGRGHAQ